ncbi:MAG: hypothetical protein ACYTF1_11305, partial [Planctomycetota bacterium]
DGEVEDHKVTIDRLKYDWSDAPDSNIAPRYPTLASNNGAHHLIDSTVVMGVAIDAEPDGQPDPNALGDDAGVPDDEDGVFFTSPIVPGQPATVDVFVSANGFVNAWINFNPADNSWAQPGDMITPAAGQLVVPGLNTINYNVPASASPGTITGGLPYDQPPGLAKPDGEVEDYEVSIDYPCPMEGHIEFSLDIGSDTELSDPTPDGNEGFDPGDVYKVMGPPVTPPVWPGGRDGFKDDKTIFSLLTDPPPDPPFPPLVVPVGSGVADYQKYFDLDGHDELDVDLTQYIPEDTPLSDQIDKFLSQCIHDVKYLAISYDDDMGDGWPNNDVPVIVPSPAGVSSYGMAINQDELIGVTLAVGPIPMSIAGIYSISDEDSVHADLAPNPAGGVDTDDDDVDSLDAVPPEDPQGEPVCPYWYFTPDHEATWVDTQVPPQPLDPGGIYLRVPGFPPVKVIDEAIHLGVPEDADIDAFEFVWIKKPDGSGLALAIIFSVDDDDSITTVDESGGPLWNPNMIYYSFMTGWSADLIDRPLDDDVDALTNWCDEIHVPGCTVPPAILSAQSVKMHLTTEWGIDMMDPLSTESRAGGVTKIRVVFDRPVDISGAVVTPSPSPPVTFVGTSQPNPDEMEIDLTGTHPVPGNGFCLIVQLDNIKCDDPGPAQPSGILNGALLKIEVLKGDANYDNFTDFNDYVKVKSVLAKNHTMPGFLPQCDVNVDGFIDFNDYVAVKSNLAKNTPACP